MLIPSKYQNAINKEHLRQIITFLVDTEYIVELMDDYSMLTIQTIPPLQPFDCVMWITEDMYKQNPKNTYVFDTPGKYKVVLKGDIFTVTKI